MITFILPFLASLGVPERFQRAVAQILALVAVALLCGSLGYCQGRSDGKAASELNLSEAARKLERAARKAEETANLLALARRRARQTETDELKGLAHEKGTNDAAGPGVRAVLGRLRERQTGAGDKATR